tara:strand:- start:522 stop:1448 length:927 start_codon:yes stop_codon:yes gene_type:complete
LTPTKGEDTMAEQQQQEAMVKEVKIEKKAFMAKPYSRDEKIKKDEEELEKLKAEQKGEKDDSETGETKKDVDDTSEPKSAEERSFKKRYGDLRRHQQTQQKEFESKIEELTSQLDSATKKEIKLPKSEEELDAWAKEYPDVAAIVETIALKKAKEQSKDIENRMAKMEDMRQEATKEKAEVELLKIHPDFSEIRDQDEFHNWAEEQPKWIQDALYENSSDARSAARAIDLYKIDKGITPKKKLSDKDAAKAVNTRSQKSEPITSESENYLKESVVQAMTTKEYEKRSDEIMEAIRSNKFIYDISGSAR